MHASWGWKSMENPWPYRQGVSAEHPQAKRPWQVFTSEVKLLLSGPRAGSTNKEKKEMASYMKPGGGFLLPWLTVPALLMFPARLRLLEARDRRRTRGERPLR